ncbi:hypothetical protein [Methylotuvimicrobium sp. KM1]|uniref:hypothetical protein n=1 Tax=Methylotuvimicrobium sp. KM1 TaxID=3377707 RepID=UPI00384DEBA6
MKKNVGSEAGAVARPTGVGGRADFCSCKICIHAILGNQSPPSSLHGRIHPAPKSST